MAKIISSGSEKKLQLMCWGCKAVKLLLEKANRTKVCALQQTTKENYVKAKMRDIIFVSK